MTDELREKVRISVQRFQDWCPPEGYFIAFSGGKDSVVIKKLAEMAGVPFDAHYQNTSVDPPELVRFIMDQHPDVYRDLPTYPDGRRITMWNLIEKKMTPPTRLIRYCCEQLKEYAGEGRMTVTGVRWAESVRRKNTQGIVRIKKNRELVEKTEEDDNYIETKRGIVLTNDNEESRKLVEGCYKKAMTILNPIIDWTEDDVWEFIKEYSVPYCGLYDEGFKRIGCIGCPMAGTKGREREFARWPKYKEMYVRAFGRALERRRELDRPGDKWKDYTAIDMYNWWMEYPVVVGQISLDELIEAQPEDNQYEGYGGFWLND